MSGFTETHLETVVHAPRLKDLSAVLIFKLSAESDLVGQIVLTYLTDFLILQAF